MLEKGVFEVYGNCSDNNYLLELRKRAKQLLKEKDLVCVVYAYSTKAAPFEIFVLDYGFLEFKTDEELNAYLKRAEPEAAMIYAVYSLR